MPKKKKSKINLNKVLKSEPHLVWIQLKLILKHLSASKETVINQMKLKKEIIGLFFQEIQNNIVEQNH